MHLGHVDDAFDVLEFDFVCATLKDADTLAQEKH
jgi:hypothetical protein